MTPWSDCVEVYWAGDAEAYVTPVADDCVGVAILTSRKGGFDDHLEAFPPLEDRLAVTARSRPCGGTVAAKGAQPDGRAGAAGRRRGGLRRRADRRRPGHRVQRRRTAGGLRRRRTARRLRPAVAPHVAPLSAADAAFCTPAPAQRTVTNRACCNAVTGSSLRSSTGSPSSAVLAAARLYAHCNTVLKPIARASELLGYASGERRLAVELALQLRRHLPPPRNGPARSSSSGVGRVRISPCSLRTCDCACGHQLLRSPLSLPPALTRVTAGK